MDRREMDTVNVENQAAEEESQDPNDPSIPSIRLIAHFNPK